jgi:hypothetical protein
MIATTAVSATKTTGSITSGSSNLTVAATGGISVGDSVVVVGAGATGSNLSANVLSIAGNVVGLDTAASTTVTNASVYKPANITNATVANTFALPGQVPGQQVDPTSVQVWFESVRVETVNGSGTSSPGITTLTFSGTAIPNVNATTNTLMAQPGDTVQVGYTNASSVTKTFTTAIQTVTTSSAQNGNLVSLTTTDIMPSDMTSNATVTIAVIKTYTDQQLASSQFDTTSVGTAGTVTIHANATLPYGSIYSGAVHFGYKALRTDLSQTLLSFTQPTDIEGLLGEISPDNPLAQGVDIALANTTGRIFGLAVGSNDLIGHQTAMDLLQSHRVYYLTPLTQDQSILEAYEAHVKQMSTPQNAAWRVVLANTAIATTEAIGTANLASPATGAAITLVNSNYILTNASATFLSDGVVPGDTVNVSVATPDTVVGTYQVQQVLSNQQVVINATATATVVSYYVTRKLTRDQQAANVAAISKVFGSNRVVHVQPDQVGIAVNGVTQYEPGYYLACGLAGMGAGFPVQQGFTNIAVAGITDLKDSNFYFTKDQLNTMAGAGTFIFVQATQGGAPYVRHELTTDMSTLEYRELLCVKNWDFLSYFYFDLITPFIGSWNITRDTLNTIRQTIIAGSELLKTKKLPKIGPPLLSCEVISLAQDVNNKDTINMNLSISIVYPNNYTNIYLVI